MPHPFRAQIVSEAIFTSKVKSASGDVDVTDHDLPQSDQNFGLVEAAAVVAFATSVAKLAELLVKVYNDVNNDQLEVTVKTASGSVTVKGKRMRNVQTLLEDLEELD